MTDEVVAGGDGAFFFLATTDTFIGVAGGFLCVFFFFFIAAVGLSFSFFPFLLYILLFSSLFAVLIPQLLRQKIALYVWILICTKNVFSKYNETNAANAQFLDAKLGVCKL
ncbi:hypothetical protein H0G86_006068 [Trichoderma simmonsii]|uniref:Uncharacterized protein n=1 Tax=Trichoderma simmonsii TaxID=1491479 RepID=A0A8G0PFR5_9HYPO|nr:hypothetical protein H0G86_006068 [Trichoderma simmonsii]